MRANQLVFRAEAGKTNFPAAQAAPASDLARVRIGKNSAWRHFCTDGVTTCVERKRYEIQK